jgi:hypothetical protein
VKKIYILILLIFLIKLVFAAEVFDINKFSNPTRYGWMNFDERKEFRQDLYDRQKLLQLYEMKSQSIPGNMIKSGLVPGWGHFSVRSYTKGQVFLGVEIILLGSSLFLYDKAMEKYNNYKNASQIDAIEKNYNDALAPYQYSIALMGLFSLVWVYNIFDTAQSTEEYNSGVWEKTMKEYTHGNVSLTPTGIEVRF